MAKHTKLYFHKPTGNICHATKAQAKKLSSEWSQVQFTLNEKGEQVMRFQFDGATVDVQENGEKEVVPNGQPVAN